MKQDYLITEISKLSGQTMWKKPRVRKPIHNGYVMDYL